MAGIRKLTNEEFIEKARKVHGDRYDYSLVEYSGYKTKLIIICKNHGQFKLSPNDHISAKRGCSYCLTNTRALGTDKFIEKANKIHNNRYDYSLVDYKNNSTKITIICKEHGQFQQQPGHHLRKQNCPFCSDIDLRQSEFIKMAKETHGDKYDYSLTEYKNTRTKVKIICKEHGEFELPPRDHYRDGRGCDICYYNDKTLEFIKRAKEIHGDKYDYSLVKFTTINKKVIIICKEHGLFKQKASHHIYGGHGCSACSKNKPLGQNGFIERAKQIHGDKYDYNLVNYTNIDSKVIIVCKVHGPFKQFAGAHARGFGCVSCSVTNISKKEILWLDYLSIPQEFRQKRIYINNIRYNLDALDKENKIIWEFYGDFWHGNPKIYNKNKINKVVKKTFGQLYQKTLQKEKDLQKAGYKLITIWECEWNKIAKTLKIT